MLISSNTCNHGAGRIPRLPAAIVLLVLCACVFAFAAPQTGELNAQIIQAEQTMSSGRFNEAISLYSELLRVPATL